MKSCLYCLCVLVCLSRCAKKKDIENEYFPIDKKLQAADFFFPTDSIGNPKRMLIVDTLLVLDDSNHDYLYKVIDLKREKIIGHLGGVGKGPGEFMQPTLFELVPGKSGVLGIYDRRSWTYSEIDIDSALENKNFGLKARFGAFNTNYSRISKLKADVFVGIGIFDKRYAVSNDSGRIVSYAMDYPYMNEFEEVPRHHIAFAFQGKLKVKPDGQKFVLAYSSSPNAEIVSVENGGLRKVVDLYYGAPSFIPENNNGMIAVTFNADNTRGFNDVSVSGDYIYLLYSGSKRPVKYVLAF